MKMQILGWKHSEGEFEGTKYNYVTLYSLARLPAKDNQRGYAGIEIKGEPALVEKLKKIEFNRPVECDVETETVAIGKGQYQEMAVNITPVTSAKAA